MYRKAFLFILVLFFSLPEVAGQKHPQFSHIGAGAGLNFAGIRSGEGYDSHDKNIGLNIGIKANYSFSKLLSAGSGISFERKGAVDETFDVNTNISYISLPLYVEWTLTQKPRFFIQTGVYGSYLINAVKKGDMRVGGQNVPVNEDLKEDFRSYDAGIILRGGFKVELNWDFDFFVSVNTSVGLLNISENSESSPKNYHFGITAGYIYYIGFR